MKKMVFIFCMCLTVVSFTACIQHTSPKNNSEKTPNIEIPKDNTVTDDKQIPQTMKISEDTIERTNPPSAEEVNYINELKQYESVNYSDGFLEIMGEKISFNGKGYQDISSRLHERVMFNAVCFYMAAASTDIDTIKKMADKPLLSEIEKSISKTGDNSYAFGGNVVTSFKGLSLYHKPISITAPKKTNENEYKVTMEYSNKNKRHFVDVIILAETTELKIKSFIIEQ